MAVVKFGCGKGNAAGALNYIMNKEKTLNKLVTGRNCVPQNADKEFDAVKKLFGKTEGRQYYHIIQSFSPDDPVDFHTAHGIGIELADYFSEFQSVVATHVDRKHTHNHIILNSVNFKTGYKFHQTAKELEQVKTYSNQLCMAHGLSTTEPKARRKQWPEWKKKLKRDALFAMQNTRSKEDFILCMNGMGYEVDWRDNHKYVTFTTPDNQKCRDNKLFDERLLKKSMEQYFAMGGCDWQYAEGYASEDCSDVAGELASLLQQIFSGHNSSDYYTETIWHSEQELEKLLLTGHKLSAPATRHVQKDDDEEYEQFHGFDLGM
ncbi:MAG: Relaxase/Mobilization nuclease domain protein [Firmicutes bacterium ADurb.Bin193]|nr:MAG: Relaxase/Mobilization nuclease domain protein [Firmicutes bacterium ADurb.Bin193]